MHEFRSQLPTILTQTKLKSDFMTMQFEKTGTYIGRYEQVYKNFNKTKSSMTYPLRQHI